MTKTKPTARAAIYARKSTDDSDRDATDKSVTRQVEHARAYARRKGWEVADAHVYVDDGVSGAEFEQRPGFARLIADIPKRGRPPFDVLVMSEASRLGRDQQRTGYFLAHIRDAGVRIHYYLDDSEELLDTPEHVLMASVKAYAGEVERMKAAQRARDALQRKAARGYCSGGRAYGYDNVQVMAEGGETKSHTDYRVNEEEAEVVRSIYRAYAAGYGPGSIARAMNGDPKYAGALRQFFGGSRPAPPRGRTGSWAPSSVREMLLNPRYEGVVPFGRDRKAYKHGTKVRVRQPDSAVQFAKRPDLRIVPDELVREARARFDAARRTYLKDTGGKLWGRPGIAMESKYLLTGLGQCSTCGRNISMVGGRGGSGDNRHPLFYYGCTYRKNRGPTVCENDHLARVADADALVIAKAREVLTPEAADYAVDRALEMLAEQRKGRHDAAARLDAEEARLRREIERFLRAIGDGKAPASVTAEIARREARLAEVAQERTTLDREPPAELQEQRMRRAFRERLQGLDALLRADVPQAREALRKLIAGKIEFRPETRAGDRGYRLRWSLVTTAEVGGYLALASPRGFEPRLSP